MLCNQFSFLLLLASIAIVVIVTESCAVNNATVTNTNGTLTNSSVLMAPQTSGVQGPTGSQSNRTGRWLHNHGLFAVQRAGQGGQGGSGGSPGLPGTPGRRL